MPTVEIDLAVLEPPICGIKRDPFFPLETDDLHDLAAGKIITRYCPAGGKFTIVIVDFDKEEVPFFHCETCELNEAIGRPADL